VKGDHVQNLDRVVDQPSKDCYTRDSPPLPRPVPWNSETLALGEVPLDSSRLVEVPRPTSRIR
jgi:hypothetical protein